MSANDQTNHAPVQILTPREKTPATPAAPFTVWMHRDLVDELDEGFSPMDGIVAIDEMFCELPLVHRALAPLRLRKRAGRKLKVYRGCFDWYKSLGFSYVQIGTTLHVLELWYCENPNLADYDVVLGTGQTAGYKPFDMAPDHATQNSQEEPTTMPR
jgi:hypothetical protein